MAAQVKPSLSFPNKHRILVEQRDTGQVQRIPAKVPDIVEVAGSTIKVPDIAKIPGSISGPLFALLEQYQNSVTSHAVDLRNELQGYKEKQLHLKHVESAQESDIERIRHNHCESNVGSPTRRQQKLEASQWERDTLLPEHLEQKAELQALQKQLELQQTHCAKQKTDVAVKRPLDIDVVAKVQKAEHRLYTEVCTLRQELKTKESEQTEILITRLHFEDAEAAKQRVELEQHKREIADLENSCASELTAFVSSQARAKAMQIELAEAYRNITQAAAQRIELDQHKREMDDLKSAHTSELTAVVSSQAREIQLQIEFTEQQKKLCTAMQQENSTLTQLEHEQASSNNKKLCEIELLGSRHALALAHQQSCTRSDELNSERSQVLALKNELQANPQSGNHSSSPSSCQEGTLSQGFDPFMEKRQVYSMREELSAQRNLVQAQKQELSALRVTPQHERATVANSALETELADMATMRIQLQHHAAELNELKTAWDQDRLALERTLTEREVEHLAECAGVRSLEAELHAVQEVARAKKDADRAFEEAAAQSDWNARSSSPPIVELIDSRPQSALDHWETQWLSQHSEPSAGPQQNGNDAPTSCDVVLSSDDRGQSPSMPDIFPSNAAPATVVSASSVDAASSGKTSKVWGSATGECTLTNFGHSGGSWSSAMTSAVLIVSNDGTAKIDSGPGQCMLALSAHGVEATSAALSSYASSVLTVSSDGITKIWDSSTGQCKLTLSGDLAEATSAVFSSDASSVLTVSCDGIVKIWDSVSGDCKMNLSDHSGRLRSATFSADGSSILTASSDEAAKIWDSSTGECRLTLSGHGAEVTSAAYSSDASSVLTVSCDGTAKIWDSVSGECKVSLCEHSGRLQSAVFSRDGLSVVTASSDDTAKIWDSATGECKLTLSGHFGKVNTAVFSADGSAVLTASQDFTSKIWNTDTGECKLTLSGHSGEVTSAVFSSDASSVLTVSTDQTAKIWDSTTGECKLTHMSSQRTDLCGHSGLLWAAGYSAGGSSVFTASSDETTKIWDNAAGEHRLALTGRGEFM